MMAFLVTLTVVFALDRAAKALAFRKPGLGGCATLVGLVTIRPVRNRHPSSWPGGSPASWILVFGVCLAGAVLFVLLDSRGATWTRLGLGAALGGATSNLYDRLRHGAVLDFLTLGRLSRFNLADAALLLGVSAALVSRALAVAPV